MRLNRVAAQITTTAKGIRSFPNELIQNIFRFINISDIRSFCLTCKRFNSLGTTECFLYALFEENVSKVEADTIKERCRNPMTDCSNLFVFLERSPHELMQVYFDLTSNQCLRAIPKSLAFKIGSKIVTRAALLNYTRGELMFDAFVGKGYPLEYLQALAAADVCVTSSSSWCTLTSAVNGVVRLEELQYLHSIGAKSCNDQGYMNTLYKCMNSKPSEDVVHWLLSIGAKPSSKETYDAVSKALQLSYSEDLILEMVEAADEVRFKNLLSALEKKYSVVVVEKMLQKGAIATSLEEGYKLLFSAIRNNSGLEILNLVLGKGGARPVNESFRNTLNFSLDFPLSVIRLVVENGATPVKESNRVISHPIPYLLMDKNVDWDKFQFIVEKFGHQYQWRNELNTCLEREASDEIIRLVLDRGAKPDDSVSRDLETPSINLALKQKRSPDILRMLLQAGGRFFAADLLEQIVAPLKGVTDRKVILSPSQLDLQAWKEEMDRHIQSFADPNKKLQVLEQKRSILDGANLRVELGFSVLLNGQVLELDTALNYAIEYKAPLQTFEALIEHGYRPCNSEASVFNTLDLARRPGVSYKIIDLLRKHGAKSSDLILKESEEAAQKIDLFV